MGKLKGDFIISVLSFIGAGTDPHRKIGIIARNSLDPNAAYADACVHGDVLTSLQYREATEAETNHGAFDLSPQPYRVSAKRQ
ncbi:MAG: hypothetical protein IPO04_19605 [Cytophagaceae bacterium]|nr:hypothetical protein [Cytophagaceae bacterium]